MRNKMKKKTVPKSALYFNDELSVELAEKGEEGEKRTAKIVGYSGKPILNHWFWDNLAIDIQGVKFQGKRIPILEQHDLYRKIGIAKKPTKLENKIEYDDVTLLENEFADEFYNNSKQGFPYQASLGVKPLRIERIEEGTSVEVNGYKLNGPGTIFRETIVRETSICVFGYDSHTNSEAFSDENGSEEIEFEEVSHEEEEFSDEKGDTDLSDDNNENLNSGGNEMNLEELKQQYPELFTEHENQVRAKVQSESGNNDGEFSEKIQQKEKEISELSAANEDFKQRITELEKNEAIRRERDTKAKADSIMEAALSESKIPKNLFAKIRGTVDYQKYCTEEEGFKADEFSQACKDEITSWEKDLGDAFTDSTPSVLGVGGSGESSFSETDEDGKDDDAVVDRVLQFAGVEPEGK